ncbi:MAG TPA: hypothetical protein VMG35_28860 [Bryobacteraceae bacterium]|nr:hypothetical protein [Bryobacteraceae bacterium]
MAVFDAYEGAQACDGSLVVTNPTITPAQPGTITVTAGSTPGFCHYTATGSDGSASSDSRLGPLFGNLKACRRWLIIGVPRVSKATPDG